MYSLFYLRYAAIVIYGKNDSVVVFKNLDLKIILLDYQNNYVEKSSIMNKTAKNFDILATSLNLIILIVQQNYFKSISR